MIVEAFAVVAGVISMFVCGYVLGRYDAQNVEVNNNYPNAKNVTIQHPTNQPEGSGDE